ncbi:MAG: hypothetical protein COX88_01470 [Candidatus Nealsonbacteria bacterium CG_4_10_14_0_2_um_filter_35_20]|uniref:DOD-type homing endonuclease domain-containing protein n=1 Tax=Candidatus Nealsonbacteria bacterium CG11_big_fil_rev_8_21_14_0_20_35_11 TaxID=1974713 RepID=A0A2H0MZT2_9BACT|nr:MAG: hypothetical protein COV62_02210 [Candidatus Nealsonbacteria bacterium CG11_big_fil_rev_8_21_14_0_20_35_11]PIW92498.1 MAG: hypothetical protein COZ88_02025 [Candidatus Nealsonbacteria bacterium CG_4_8_14_3_um_filter_34_13]PIZ89892.1 MAG: hypothetical protein COX88_01470 [Candidatus Nealsonbacteria bacterium CG_4_10_14_0_2_um_filter_35_20]
MDISLLKYSQKSHRKIVKIPSESVNLSELMGIIFGDGGINNDWQVVITLNSKSDLKYSYYVRKLLKKLLNSVANIFNKFKIKPHIADKGRRIYLYGVKDIIDYLRIFGSSNPRIINKYKEWRGARAV